MACRNGLFHDFDEEVPPLTRNGHSWFLKGCRLNRPWFSNPESQDPALILESLEACAAQMYVSTRTPVVPGFNDVPGLTGAIVDLVKEVGAERCRFLHLDRRGEHKYERLALANTYRHLEKFLPGGIDRLKERYPHQGGFVFFEAA